MRWQRCRLIWALRGQHLSFERSPDGLARYRRPSSSAVGKSRSVTHPHSPPDGIIVVAWLRIASRPVAGTKRGNRSLPPPPEEYGATSGDRRSPIAAGLAKIEGKRQSLPPPGSSGWSQCNERRPVRARKTDRSQQGGCGSRPNGNSVA